MPVLPGYLPLETVTCITSYVTSKRVLKKDPTNCLPCLMQDFENGVGDVKSRDVIEMMMITQYFDMLKVLISPDSAMR